MKYPNPRAVAGIIAALSLGVAISGCGNAKTSDPATGMTDMPGMAKGPAAASSPPSTMAGMRPLVAGADGTRDSAGGLRLAAGPTVLQPGKPTKVVLTVTGPNGTAIKAFAMDQTKLMHLIVVRDDLTGYQHLHPTLDPATGRFTVTMTVAKPGLYRAIADFTTAGRRYALRADLTAQGRSDARAPLPGDSNTATVDGFTVKLSHKPLIAGRETLMSFRIGNPQPTPLDPYLGAAGHLVALRASDLAYSHVHPVASDMATGSMTFSAEFPTADRYRLFVQFNTGGTVHTAKFTVTVAK